MSKVSEGLEPIQFGEGPDEELLNAFISAGDLDGLGLEEEAPTEPQQAAEDADQLTEEDPEGEDTETKAEGADEAAGEEEGDFVEWETEEGETARVSVEDLMQAYNQQQQLGPDAEAIRTRIATEAMEQIAPIQQSYQQQVGEVIQLYQQLNSLMPDLSEPDISLLRTNPRQYAEQMEAYKEVSAIMGGAREKMVELQQQSQEAAEKARALQVQKDWATLVSLDPTWNQGDNSKRLNDLRTHIVSTYNIPAEIVGTITDPGFIRMAEDAAAYKQATSTKLKAKPKSAPKLIKGKVAGKSAVDPTKTARKKADEFLRKTGKAGDDLESQWGQFLD